MSAYVGQNKQLDTYKQTIKEAIADEAVMMDRNTKKLAAPENLNYGAGEATMTTEVSQQTENIKVGEPGSGG